MTDKTFYITTAIDYVNSEPHIGTAYEKVCADVLARYHRLAGYDVHFLMGNDEHSINVKKEAERLGYAHPKDYCDAMAEQFQRVWASLNISYDDFIRTTEERHQRGVRRLFQRLYDNGDIYHGQYKGWYCESCEAFLPENDLQDGKCAIHRTVPKWLEEDNYFFALSRYRDRLLSHIQAHPQFIEPESRRNEILALLHQGLEDLSISRATFDWGIPLPIDENHVVYVWVDALINYISALGYGAEDSAAFARYWPADLHVIGKDITRFHCVIWPAMLMSAGVELPKQIFGHGFISIDGQKLSKSRGTLILPQEVIDQYGADAFRYFILREVPFGQDGDFSWRRFISRYNADLANDLGNLVSRTLAMVERYFQSRVPEPGSSQGPLQEKLEETVARLKNQMAGYVLHGALTVLWELVTAANRYIEEQAPWVLVRDPDRHGQLATVLYDLLETIRASAILLTPFLPDSAQSIWQQLGLQTVLADQRLQDATCWGQITPGTLIRKGQPLFPRIDSKAVAGKELTSASANQPQPRGGAKAGSVDGPSELIDMAMFQKLDLRIGRITTAEPVPQTDKLLRLEVDLGQEKRQVVAGIAHRYSGTDLIGQQVVILANLKPAILRGIKSQGMLLAASSGTTIALLQPDQSVPPGSKVR